jgi:GH18 family chitinase
MVHQGYLEPHNAVAIYNSDGKSTIWTSTQGSFAVRALAAAVAGVPETDLKVVPAEIGGGFGGKLTIYYDPIALVPYMTRIDGDNGYITYDDAFSTYYRTSYSDWTRGLGGMFMWSLDADYDGQSQDLLDAMYHATIDGAKSESERTRR